MALSGWDINKKITITPDTGKVSSTISDIALPIHLSGINFEPIFNELTPLNVDDDFTGDNGDVPNYSFWTQEVADIVPTINNNRLQFIHTDTSISRVRSNYKLSGDFDIQFDYDVTGAPLTSIWLLNLAISTTQDRSDNYYYVDIRYTGSKRYLNQSVLSGVSDSSYYDSDIVDAGKLRITRVGSTVTSYVWDGAQFVQAWQKAGWLTDDVYIIMSSRTTATMDFTSYIDNFVVNSGTVIWDSAPKKLALEIGNTGSQCYVEVNNDLWDATNKEAIVWAGISSLSQSSEFNLYYDSSQADNTTYVDETGNTAAQQVWGSTAKFTTLQGDPSGTILDSTSYEANGTSSGSMTSGDLVEGISGSLIELDGTDDYVSHGYNAAHDITDTLTIEAVIKPSQTLDNNLTNAVGIVSRQHNPAVSEDTYVVYINSSGQLSFSSSGGNLIGTTDSFSSDTEYYISVTYNSTGLVGNLFLYNLTNGTGAKEILTTDSLDTMAGSTNDLVIGLNYAPSNQFFPGGIGFVRISQEVKSDDYIAVMAEALGGNLFTTYVEGVLYKLLSQPYLFPVISVVEQSYLISTTILNYIDQLYGINLSTYLSQKYDDQEILQTQLVQWYRSSPVARKVLNQAYEDAKQVESYLVNTYSLTHDRARQLIQEYVIAGVQHAKILEAPYDIKNVFELTTELKQSYNIMADSRFIQDSTTLTINAKQMEFTGIDIEFSQDSYAGSCSINLANFSDWDSIDYKDEVTVDHNSFTYSFVVTSKTRSENYQTETLSVESMSKAVLLDFPYATEVDGNDLITGAMSTIVDSLAGLESQSIVWDEPVDENLTENEVQSDGNSPLTTIKSIVNSIGGIVQSRPNGDIHAEPKYIIDSDKYDTVSADVYTSGENFISLSDETDKRDGHNKYYVSNISAEDGYTVESEELTPSHHIVKAYKVPWSSEVGELTTSELSGVTIYKRVDPVLEEIEEEDVEIVNGSGSLSNNWYGTISVDYGNRENLGDLTIYEDGTFTADVVGSSLLNITYYTKYWAWDTYNNDKEQVQFILESVE